MVSMPLSRKQSVATRDRLESLASPQTPWPLVQPLPVRVPKPTINPESIKKTMGKSIRGVKASGTLQR